MQKLLKMQRGICRRQDMEACFDKWCGRYYERIMSQQNNLVRGVTLSLWIMEQLSGQTM